MYDMAVQIDRKWTHSVPHFGKNNYIIYCILKTSTLVYPEFIVDL